MANGSRAYQKVGDFTLIRTVLFCEYHDDGSKMVNRRDGLTDPLVYCPLASQQ
jgi:hypothetical protein